MATKKSASTKKKAKRAKRAILRKYKGSDSYMLEQGQTLHDLFALDKADFIALVLDLADPYVTDWQTAITAAVNYTDDSVIVGQIAPQTLSVKLAMKAGIDKYNVIIFYAERAYGKKSPVLKEFGRGKTYEKASRGQERMFEFLDELSTTANKYKVDLIAKGCTQPLIDEIATVRDALNTANRNQNLAIRGRPVISEGRTKAYNTAYDFLRSVVDAAKLVYKNQPAKLGQYIFRPPSNGSSGTETIDINALANNTTLAVELDYRADRALQFTNTGTNYLSIGLNTDGGTGFPTPPALVPAGGTATLVMSDLGPAGTFIMIQNPHLDAGTGTLEYEV